MSEQPKNVFRVHINGTLDQVWNELTKTHEVQKAMFNSRMHTTQLVPGAPIRMCTADGKYTAVAGEVIEIQERVRFSHTFRFTSYDDPACEVVYDLAQQEGGVSFTLTILNLAEGTKTAKQMRQGGPMICNTLKAVVEIGKPPLGTRLLYGMFGLLAPFTPKRCLSDRWPLDGALEGGGHGA